MRTSIRKPSERNQSSPTVHTPKLLLTAEQIQQRIHEIYLARGGAAGRELDDWFRAERELQAGKSFFPTY